jgi:hypothetical protein
MRRTHSKEQEGGHSAPLVTEFRAYARFVSVDTAKNRFRFYALTRQPGLWGGGALIHTWGRIGQALRRRSSSW